METSYYILKHYRLNPSYRDRRIKALEHCIEQLQKYYAKAPDYKKPTIKSLINLYSSLLDRLDK